MKKIYAVILAAGTSSRLGSNKLTIKINGRYVIEMATEPFFQEVVERVYLVTNPKNDYVKNISTFDCSALTIITNRNFKEGMSSSIKAVLPYIEDSDAVFFHLGDKPFLKREMVRYMVERFEGVNNNGHDIVVPLHQGRKGHPVLMDVKPYITEMKKLNGDMGLRETIEKNSKNVLFIEGDEGNVFDIDSEDEINILEERGYIIEKG
ncbi:MAG TPA: nucleotidyltransferase family protein [Syntrophorhabdaceae bacterium]|jgi:molybdenum cofactor cytidylyltransferase|nr:nucleotidyltransferase family protein [Syntrophorhabdaceae bacterium]HOF58179.1 nucleotidyltransferase family protein [Syntrophorhabdaceae bacterium]HOG40795.1 nucleotidyltransferase family protein [Syntrophorhabdaceae bacterium]HOS06097.1 nucleotidyltransferase family protein [Syntrophorhabdaceae bacterium]HOS58757.1 nucleotidyltransferase family protein [Syntrophorhabdaceae bacterium]